MLFKISMKTNTITELSPIGFATIGIIFTFISSILFSSCEKKDVATSTATLRTKEIALVSMVKL